MSIPTVSVVIPAYNASATIARAIDSCLAQTIPLSQIIVVDDGSKDGLAEIVQDYGAAVTLIRQSNSRTAAARNRAVDVATGDFIGFLDADDHWETNKIERQLSIFEKHPDVNVVAGRFFCETPGLPRTLNELRTPHRYDRPPAGQRTGRLYARNDALDWNGTGQTRCHRKTAIRVGLGTRRRPRHVDSFGCQQHRLPGFKTAGNRSSRTRQSLSR